MSEAYLSEYEKLYLLHGVQVLLTFELTKKKILKYVFHLKDDLRLDGRSTNDYRPMRVEFNPINNSYGSCQLTLVNIWKISFFNVKFLKFNTLKIG